MAQQRFISSSHQSAPDTIRGQGMVYTDAQPQAEPVSTYVAPSRPNVGSTTGENMISQLAAGLSHLNAGLEPIAQNYVKRHTQEEQAAADAAFQKAKAQNITDIKEAQAKGLIDTGASPVFIEAWKMTQLKLAAEQAHQLMQEAWNAPENDQVRNYEGNLHSFDIWAKDWRNKYNAGLLNQFTELEIHHSGYHQILDKSEAQLRGQHLHWQIKERERQAADTGSNLVLQRLDEAFDGKDVTPSDHPAIASHLNNVFYDPQTGLAMLGGMNFRQANEIIGEAIVTKAVSAGDASILDLASHLGRDPKVGNSMARTKWFIDKAETARQHIANTNWFNEERARKRAAQKGEGLDTLEAVEERARQDRQRIEEEYANQKLQRDQYEKRVTKQNSVEPELSAIVKLHAVDGDTTSKELRDHLKAIASSDPDTYRNVTSWLQSQARSGKSVEEQAALMTFTRLRAQISDNPTQFDARQIIKEASKGHITASQVNELFSLVDQSKKTARDFPLLTSPLINGLRSDLRGAVGQGPLDDFGVGRIRADKAAAELNGLISGYLRSHPKATEYELYEAIQPHVEKIARKHSEELNQSLSYQEKPKGDSVKRAQLDAQLKSKYPNKTQRDEIVNQLLRQQGAK